MGRAMRVTSQGNPEEIPGELLEEFPEGAAAVTGISCRFPGASGPDEFWSLLAEGRDAIGPPSAQRRRAAPEESDRMPDGGFLEQVDRFDAEFFRIPPRAAAAMDPQQRLLLELAWEVCEDAAVLPGALRGSATAVFVGAISDDYSVLAHRLAPGRLPRDLLAGTHRAVIANRVSHTLGLRGPSLTVDSGQSSSLVAVHLACEALRGGQADLALAGGVNLNLLAQGALRVRRFGALSPTGRCHTLDARADGYARGEGGGLVLLKPLARAVADGDRIYCVVAGSAVNNDGGTQALGVPGARGQREVIAAACARAGADPAAVQYVELHGTGTRVGDRVEATALAQAIGAAKPGGEPLLVGSAKTNVGHLEGGAGIVGLIKTALCISHRAVPPSLNFQAPPADLPLAELNLRVPVTTGPWPRPDRPLLAGVSSFGLGGTNCHAILAQAPPAPPAPPGPGAGREAADTVWLLSGHSEAALRAQAAALLEHARARPDLDPPAVGQTLARARTALGHRAALVGAHRADLLDALDALAQGAPAPHLLRGTTGHHTGTGKPVFVFPGQGAQWTAMAAGLLGHDEVFTERIQDCERAFAPHLDWSLTDVLLDRPGAPGLDHVEVVQPALFAMMVALAALWRAAGVEPGAVVGHSQGEIAAAHTAGALTLPDAAWLVVQRSRAVAALSGRGAMASVPLAAEPLTRLLTRWHGRIALAALNGPQWSVVSGDRDAVGELLAHLAGQGTDARAIAVDYASHCAHVDPLREPLLRALAPLTPRPTTIAFHSTVTGRPAPGTDLDAAYWFRNLRSTVRLAPVVADLLAAGHHTFIEISPHPVLTGALNDTLGTHGSATATLRRGDGGPRRWLTCLADAHTHGAHIAWPAVLPGPATRHHPLPGYRFQRERHWLDTTTDTPPPPDPHREPHPEPAAAATAGAGAGLAGALAGLGEAEQRDLLLQTVRAHTAALLGHRDAHAVDPRTPFKDLGFDSPAAVELRARLAADLALDLPTSLTFNHPTCARLADHLHTTLTTPPATTATTPGAALDALEAALADTADQPTRARAATRLRHLLRRLEEPGPGSDPAETIMSATTEEILALIDNRGPS